MVGLLLGIPAAAVVPAITGSLAAGLYTLAVVCGVGTLGMTVTGWELMETRARFDLAVYAVLAGLLLLTLAFYGAGAPVGVWGPPVVVLVAVLVGYAGWASVRDLREHVATYAELRASLRAGRQREHEGQ